MKILKVGCKTEEYDYNLCNIKLSIQYRGKAEQLKSFFKQHRVRDGSGVQGKLVVCRNEYCIPAGSRNVFSGRYKGIPYKTAFFAGSASGCEQVFFCAPFFLDFLALRIAIWPYLKQKIAELGGFALLGSAFFYQGKTFLLFGHPGCGKTVLLLQALKMGAEFVGDDELFVLPPGGIKSFFNRIELRYHTARKSGFWDSVAPSDKRRLWLYWFIAAASAKRVTFNIALSPEGLGIKKHVAGPERGRTVFVHMGQGGCQKALISAEEAAGNVLQYEEWYRRIYGDMFGAAAGQEEIRGRITSFFAESACWRISSETGIRDVLDLSGRPD